MERGRYRATLVHDGAVVARAQIFRAACFGVQATHDRDAYDPRCIHVLITETDSGAAVCCFRMLHLTPSDITQSYSAQFYDLSPLERYCGDMLEVGRFCLRPGCVDPDVLRLAWAVLTARVDALGVAFLFGCSSFQGTVPALYDACFALLAHRHIAPCQWLPGVKVAEHVALACNDSAGPDHKRAMTQTPPLLRSYLGLGAWVSDHAVIDRQMDTMHVFTGVEVALIPPARKRALRYLVGTQ
ncbi:GNAT family N-acetyltransferase [Roseobacter denitrificans]|uniref:L-ornithine N(alpha)-acyltransferase n=1 Tax=Roseobacter denitrificans (strain ATCC 33942 / OCh 114) TaxID=375451 RepID=Q164D5_ROSDO|nr:GNAT family N-acetyltransferase [Roseobacter denitrificans]ABG32658.1 conserved hypothetical protein [Roseobacter denitrificans OCh 114]AVL52092.1 GNAT family N-acetyltransferase [Roseobacter denitrificans]SFF93369.1 ornithine-acyl[acyl carrier protein] N-acyltransferase [Roseobacter denitrificans OCh 114]